LAGGVPRRGRSDRDSSANQATGRLDDLTSCSRQLGCSRDALTHAGCSNADEDHLVAASPSRERAFRNKTHQRTDNRLPWQRNRARSREFPRILANSRKSAGSLAYDRSLCSTALCDNRNWRRPPPLHAGCRGFESLIGHLDIISELVKLMATRRSIRGRALAQASAFP
jgi:hypothetical protein